MKLQEESDPYFRLPLDIIGGCSCKNVCKTCSCLTGDTSVNRKKQCTPISCRCKCTRDHAVLTEMEADNESDDSIDEGLEGESTDEEQVISMVPYDPYAGMDFSSEDEL